MNCSNDVHSPNFESKMDDYFRSKFKEGKYGTSSRWHKDSVRSELATTRPRRSHKSWAQGIIGVKSAVAK